MGWVEVRMKELEAVVVAVVVATEPVEALAEAAAAARVLAEVG